MVESFLFFLSLFSTVLGPDTGLLSRELVTSYANHLIKKHDMLLGMLFEHGSYKKLYSYKHLINGFAVHLSPEQVKA